MLCHQDTRKQVLEPAMNKRSPRWSVILLGLLIPITISAQAPQGESEATDEEAETIQAPAREDEPSEDKNSSQDDQDAEELEEPAEIDDFIPSEMISEDLAVDLPIDI